MTILPLPAKMEDDTAGIKLRQDNARKAKEAADKFFPGENWKFVEEGIYLSSRRPTGKHSNHNDELKDARILQSYGSTVYLVPDDSRQPGRKFDAIVNGSKFEFKNMQGKGISTLQERSQAPNVFINLENSSLTKNQAISALYGARNNTKRYTMKNCFTGGRIILKIRGHKNLIYLDVDRLKVQ